VTRTAPPGRKIPPLDARYWALLIAATVFGETSGDMLSQGLGLGYLAATAIFVALFVAAVAVQMTRGGAYWAVIVATSTAGTTISDALTRTYDLGYATGALVLLSALAMVLLAWRLGGHRLRDDGSLPASSELLYWTGILVASTLGTAFGDWIADASGLGFAGSSLVLGALLIAVAVLQRVVRGQRELFYWAAIIVVHPIGATAGDFLSKPAGLGLGTFAASAVLAVLFAGVIGLTWRRASD
jgi:uncharacterized membrane-anchored protein